MNWKEPYSENWTLTTLRKSLGGCEDCENRAVPSLHNFQVTSKTILKSFVVFQTRTSTPEPHFSNNRSLLLDYLIEDLLSYYPRGIKLDQVDALIWKHDNKGTFLPGDAKGCFDSWMEVAVRRDKKGLWMIAFFSAIWEIWNQRNVMMFKRGKLDINKMKGERWQDVLCYEKMIGSKEDVKGMVRLCGRMQKQDAEGVLV
ncbi:hypothetical protein PIB30_097976 [Stylosanthes scabra]|uniref:Uncharacterized protein n=1 Tax=Stylosanthes scabra TaxID=79078 RepID=A0ABU6VUW7_9FABA|nr:hypothetical protein [Stylosanthes scabra]